MSYSINLINLTDYDKLYVYYKDKYKICYIKGLNENKKDSDELNGFLYVPDKNSKTYILSRITLKTTEEKDISYKFKDIAQDLYIYKNQEFPFHIIDTLSLTQYTKYKSAIINYFSDIENWMRTLLTQYAASDSNINIDFEDASNPSDIYENAEKITDVFRIIVSHFERDNEKYYKKDDTVITMLNHIVNFYKERISNSDYIGDRFIVNIDEKDVSDMEAYYEKALNIMKKRYKNQWDSSPLRIIPYNRDSQSKLYRYRLIKALTDAVYLVNEDIGILNKEIGVRVINNNKFTLDIDPLSIDDTALDLMDAINKFYERLVKISDVYMVDLKNVHDRVNEIYEINLEEKEKNNKPSINSEIVQKLKFASNHPISNPRAVIKMIKELIPKSQNKLTFEGIVKTDTDNVKSLISKKNLSPSEILLLRFILKSIENNVKFINNDDVDDSYYQIYDLLLKQIKLREQKLKSYSHSEINYHRKEIDDFLILVFHYNEMISTAYFENKINIHKHENENIFSPYKIDVELEYGIKYVYTCELNKAIVSIVRNNPDKFKQGVKLDYSENFYNWGEYATGDFSLNYLNQVISTQVSKREHALEQIEKESDNATRADLINSYITKYYLTRSQSPGTKPLDHYSDVIINLPKIANTIQREIDLTIAYLFGFYKDFIISVEAYDKNVNTYSIITDKTGLVVSTFYKDAETFKDMFDGITNTIKNLQKNGQLTESVKKDIDYSAKRLNKCIQGTRYKFAQMMGRERNQTFDVVMEQYKKMTEDCIEFAKLNEEIGSSNTINLCYNDETIDYISDNIKRIHEYKNSTNNVNECFIQ